MALALKKPAYETRRYTYADYCKWEGPERWELIDGVPYMMAAPSVAHQWALSSLHRQIANFLHGKNCIVLFAPLDVRLNADFRDNTVVQPDLLVVCDKSKIDRVGLRGAPDMAVEILSPSTADFDKVDKLALYMKAGVREYWIVDPDAQTVAVHVLGRGKYSKTVYEKPDSVPVSVLPGCLVDLREVFLE